KILALSVILIGGAFILFLDDDPEPAPPMDQVAMADGGLLAEGGADPDSSIAVAPGTSVTAPPASPCPPGFQAYGEVRPGQPVTCVPVPPTRAGAGADPNNAGGGAVATGDPTGGGAAAPSDAVATAANEPKPKVGSSQKTLERQAVDYVAIGEYQKAIGIYEQLARQFPDNKVYSEALRILHQKL